MSALLHSAGTLRNMLGHSRLGLTSQCLSHLHTFRDLKNAPAPAAACCHSLPDSSRPALHCRDREDAPSSSVLSSPTYSTATSTSQRSPQLVQEHSSRVEQGSHRTQTPPTRR